jgi:hypothetical protein
MPGIFENLNKVGKKLIPSKKLKKDEDGRAEDEHDDVPQREHDDSDVPQREHQNEDVSKRPMPSFLTFSPISVTQGSKLKEPPKEIKQPASEPAKPRESSRERKLKLQQGDVSKCCMSFGPFH